jgi:hypothetical protein
MVRDVFPYVFFLCMCTATELTLGRAPPPGPGGRQQQQQKHEPYLSAPSLVKALDPAAPCNYENKSRAASVPRTLTARQ